MKFLTHKVIKGKTYHYLQYKTFSKSLGSVLPALPSKIMLEFFENVGLKQFESLSDSVKKSFKYGDLKQLEIQHYWYLCISESEFFEEKYHDLLFWFTILFTFNSNRVEGSKVTRPEIEKFAFSKVRKPKTKTDREILNSFRAFKYVLSSEMRWNTKHIKKIHSLLLEDLDPIIAGKWKTENNIAPGHQTTTDHKEVSKKMKELLDWLNKGFKKGIYPPLLALRFYYRFEKIHPFLDGNGRVGRILLNGILHKYSYMPVVFFTENFKEHCGAIKQAIDRNEIKITKHFLSQVKKTTSELKQLLKH